MILIRVGNQKTIINNKVGTIEEIYRIYSSERPGRSFNFWFSKGGANSREALI